MAKREHWKREPETHDYPAALEYLTLLLSDTRARSVVARLRRARIINRKAKDLLRASGLPALPATNAHVALDLKKVKKGRRLSPILLVRGDLRIGVPLTIADGYHRICASYLIDENADIPCRLVSIQDRARR